MSQPAASRAAGGHLPQAVHGQSAYAPLPPTTAPEREQGQPTESLRPLQHPRVLVQVQLLQQLRGSFQQLQRGLRVAEAAPGALPRRSPLSIRRQARLAKGVLVSLLGGLRW